MQVRRECLRRPKAHRLVCFLSLAPRPRALWKGQVENIENQGCNFWFDRVCEQPRPRRPTEPLFLVPRWCAVKPHHSLMLRAPLAMPCPLATVSSCALLFFSRHAQAFQLAPSSFHNTRIKTFESSASTGHAAAASWAPRSRRRQRSFSTMTLSGSGGSGNDGVGGGDSWFSEWKRSLVAASVALSIFGGSVLTTSPGVMPLQDGAGRSSSSVAMAAMAPSLMQDEKGYISIFEKVICLSPPIPYLCCSHVPTAASGYPHKSSKDNKKLGNNMNACCGAWHSLSPSLVFMVGACQMWSRSLRAFGCVSDTARFRSCRPRMPDTAVFSKLRSTCSFRRSENSRGRIHTAECPHTISRMPQKYARLFVTSI